MLNIARGSMQLKSHSKKTNRFAWKAAALCLAILIEPSTCFASDKQLEGTVRDIEFNRTPEPAKNDNNAPAWFGASDISISAKELDTRTTFVQSSNGDLITNLEYVQLKNNIGDSVLKARAASQNVSTDSSITSPIDENFKRLKDGNVLLDALTHTQNESKLTNVNIESAWQMKYWDSWWHRFDSTAQRKINRSSRSRCILYANTYIDLIIYREGSIDVRLVQTDSTEHANIVIDTYKNLAYTKIAKFPDWSKRQSVEENRHIWMGGRRHSDYKTGDCETISVNQ